MTPSPLRTLQIGKGWFPEDTGGLDRYYYELLDALPAAEVQTAGLVTGSCQVAAESAGRVRAFAPTRAPLATRWRGVRRSARASLRDSQVDVVAAHFALYAAPCLDLLRAAPLVVHFQGPWAAESRVEGAGTIAVEIKARIERAVYQRAQRCITLSQAFATLLAERYGVAPDRIVTVPGGINAARWASGLSRRDARDVLGWPQDRPIVLAVRRLARRMGLDQLVAAIPLLCRAVPDVLVHLAGRGSLAADLERRRHDSGLERHLRLVGYLPDELLPIAYRAADLTVVPSVALEGFGLVVAESLASGTPALVSDVGGLPEVVGGIAPQCVVPDASAASWALALADALLGRLQIPPPAALAAHVRATFDWSVVAPRITAIYREAAA